MRSRTIAVVATSLMLFALPACATRSGPAPAPTVSASSPTVHASETKPSAAVAAQAQPSSPSGVQGAATASPRTDLAHDAASPPPNSLESLTAEDLSACSETMCQEVVSLAKATIYVFGTEEQLPPPPAVGEKYAHITGYQVGNAACKPLPIRPGFGGPYISVNAFEAPSVTLTAATCGAPIGGKRWTYKTGIGTQPPVLDPSCTLSGSIQNGVAGTTKVLCTPPGGSYKAAGPAYSCSTYQGTVTVRTQNPTYGPKDCTCSDTSTSGCNLP